MIHEGQRLNDVGLKLKISFDSLQDIQLIEAGSSAFEFKN